MACARAPSGTAAANPASPPSLKPAIGRANLTVMTNAPIARVVIENRAASGVEVLVDGGTRRIEARREVILSGGAIGSPQMLLLSGIGDGEALRKLGIAVQHDLPAVGANYHDHIAAMCRCGRRMRSPTASR